ncbi:DEAD/DEAH box helicase [Candidiatus Paracoxiella cheracis]|uniref:DEAD/DEAH box helicase n=1 Tax=Candidiatus Paracoxiella cheracis TaxID=3405120 RepID=UPI003BF59779
MLMSMRILFNKQRKPKNMTSALSFEQLGLERNILRALNELGYERPSPIQEKSIPILVTGRDLLAQAQTGTGKTAAFALPVLNQLALKKKEPQVLVLTPTRELAIQVAEAFQSYAKHIPEFHVLPIYGGQEYKSQLRALKRGVHVVVGTPGRVMDHLERGTLKTNSLATLILDEADEMLRMGFIEAVEWILAQIKHEHQTAFFSATLPASIQRVAKQFLKNPARIHIEPTVTTVDSITQQYMLVSKKNKLDALTRYFEVEEMDAALIFTGTKTFSVEVAERLAARGYAVAALNGDMSQSLREQVISKIKKGTIDIIVATEVAARGLDVERITHVINFDIPQTVESYIHRIGRTGRAGQTGKALLLVTPREQRMLQEIERGVSHQIKSIQAPSINQVQQKRNVKFKTDIMNILTTKDVSAYRELIENIALKNEHSELDIAAAIAYLACQHENASLEELEAVHFEKENRPSRSSRPRKGGHSRRQSSAKHKPKANYHERDARSKRKKPAKKKNFDHRKRHKNRKQKT